MRPSKYLTGDDFENLFLHNGRYWFFDNEGETLVVPAVGDIIEYENGERNVVCFYSSFDEEGNLALDVRMFDKLGITINRRGRSSQALSITSEAEEGSWPIPGSKLIRDGKVIYPISKCYYVINKSLLLKQSLKQKALELYYLSLNKTLNVLDAAKVKLKKLKKKSLDLYAFVSSKASNALDAVEKGIKKLKNKLLSLPDAASRFWKAISDTFSKFLDMSKNMLKKLKNIFY
jgi:hypothetical protein